MIKNYLLLFTLISYFILLILLYFAPPIRVKKPGVDRDNTVCELTDRILSNKRLINIAQLNRSENAGW